MPNLANLPVADLQAGTANWSGQGYIEGLKMVWNSATSLSVTSGAAFIPSLSKCLQSPSAIAKTGLSLTASTWYHVYLYLNAGVPDIEIVTTAPAAAYAGTARTKTGDTSRRYVGSVKTNAGGSIYNFRQSDSKTIEYLVVTTGAPFRVLSAGTATTKTTVNSNAAVPLTALFAHARATNTTPSYLLLDTPDASTGLTALGDCMNRIPVNFETYCFLPLDGSQQFSYAVQNATSGGAYMDIMGYTYER